MTKTLFFRSAEESGFLGGRVTQNLIHPKELAVFLKLHPLQSATQSTKAQRRCHLNPTAKVKNQPCVVAQVPDW
jgi:hypothetical protein